MFCLLYEFAAANTCGPIEMYPCCSVLLYPRGDQRGRAVGVSV